ncbi:MAG: hypothetical protein IVW55_15060 [Chloroflexi bacterium]|nr:hypothetical protein [Chloroflexota bacterium]
MRGLELVWGVTWRMTIWGLAGGALLGIVYGGLFGGGFGALTGVIFGGLLGIVLGLLDGVVLAAITYASPTSQTGSARRHAVTLTVSTVIAGFGTLLGSIFLGLSYHLSEVLPWVVFTAMPVLLAMSAARFATDKVAAWVEKIEVL